METHKSTLFTFFPKKIRGISREIIGNPLLSFRFFQLNNMFFLLSLWRRNCVLQSCLTDDVLEIPDRKQQCPKKKNFFYFYRLSRNQEFKKSVRILSKRSIWNFSINDRITTILVLGCFFFGGGERETVTKFALLLFCVGADSRVESFRTTLQNRKTWWRVKKSTITRSVFSFVQNRESWTSRSDPKMYAQTLLYCWFEKSV